MVVLVATGALWRSTHHDLNAMVAVARRWSKLLMRRPLWNFAIQSRGAGPSQDGHRPGCLDQRRLTGMRITDTGPHMHTTMKRTRQCGSRATARPRRPQHRVRLKPATFFTLAGKLCRLPEQPAVPVCRNRHDHRTGFSRRAKRAAVATTSCTPDAVRTSRKPPPLLIPR